MDVNEKADAADVIREANVIDLNTSLRSLPKTPDLDFVNNNNTSTDNFFCSFDKNPTSSGASNGLHRPGQIRLNQRSGDICTN